MKGFLIATEVKLLQPVNETSYSIPTDGANWCYLNRLTSEASVTQSELEKRAIW